VLTPPITEASKSDYLRAELGHGLAREDSGL